MTIFIQIIDKMVKGLALIGGWCALAMILLQLFAVIARYVFQYNFVQVQESVVYLHAILFLFGSAFILQINEHVRVDIFYEKFSTKRKRILNLITVLVFILPVIILIFWQSTPYVLSAWKTLEGSPTAGGLPLVYLLKSCILIFALSVLLQTLSILAKLISSHPNSKWDV